MCVAFSQMVEPPRNIRKMFRNQTDERKKNKAHRCVHKYWACKPRVDDLNCFCYWCFFLLSSHHPLMGWLQSPVLSALFFCFFVCLIVCYSKRYQNREPKLKKKLDFLSVKRFAGHLTGPIPPFSFSPSLCLSSYDCVTSI